MAATFTIEQMPPPFKNAAASASAAWKPVRSRADSLPGVKCWIADPTKREVIILASMAYLTGIRIRARIRITAAGRSAAGWSVTSLENRAVRSVWAA